MPTIPRFSGAAFVEFRQSGFDRYSAELLAWTGIESTKIERTAASTAAIALTSA